MKIAYPPEATETLDRMPRNVARLIIGKIERMGESPEAAQVKPLRGAPGNYRLRVGDWRVIFSKEADTILAKAIGSRGSIYR